MLDRTGYRAELESSSDPQDLARLDNLNELVSVAHEFSTDLANAEALGRPSRDDEDVPDTGVLAAFLERVSLVADADELPEHGAGVVTMMTLHTAKGLEFPVVFVTGWEDGMFPHMRALGDPTELSEERRLAYVGITRARQRLYLSRARSARRGASRCSTRSRGSCARSRRSSSTGGAPTRRRRFARRSAGRAGSGRRGRRRRAAAAGKRPLLVLEPGDRVSHDKYGLGRVEEVSGVGRVGDVAHRLRQLRAGQADAQPRAGRQALAPAMAHRSVAGSSASTTLGTGSTGIAYTTGASFAPGTNRPRRSSAPPPSPPRSATSQPAPKQQRDQPGDPWRRRRPRSRKPTATQNSRSVSHQPVIRSVAITAVAHPLMMRPPR